ncbi:MAG TPA: TadE family protein [Candidatus Limnocylindrales bacterium]
MEFALVFPVMLLLVLFGIDFGRVFLGWVELNNAVRNAANYAAENPEAWSTTNPILPVQQQYRTLVQNEAARINCALPATIPPPAFTNGFNGPKPIGSPVSVRITCSFSFITPVMGSFFGGALPVAASASYPTRNGMIPNIPLASVAPSASPSQSPSDSPSASPSGSPSASPSSSPSASPSPTPTPEPVCTIPNFHNVKAENVSDMWTAAGFTMQVLFNPLAPAAWPNGGGNTTSQTVPAGVSRPCTTTAITVAWQ